MTALFSAVLLTACGDDDAPINEAAKGRISLSGTARVNQTLSIVNDFTDRNGIESITSSYQWYGNGSAITGAVDATLLVDAAHNAQDIHVVMNFLDDDGFAETLTSESVSIYDAYKLSMAIDNQDTIVITDSEDLVAKTDAQDIVEDWTTPVEPVVTDLTNERHTFPSIAADEKGNLVAVAVSKDNATYGTDGDIVFTRSTDNGLTWDAIDLLVAADADGDEAPVVATDKNGNWIVVWSSDRSIGATGSDFDIFYVTSSNNGETWTGPEPLNEWADSDTLDDKTPQISINGANWAITWSSTHDPDDGISNNPDKDTEIFSSFSSDSGAEWSTPKRISKGGIDNTTEDTMPRMHINSAGNGLVIWTAEDGSEGDTDIYAALTFTFGETWLLGFVLNDDTAGTDTTTDNEKADSVYTLKNGTYVATWHGFVGGVNSNKGAFYVDTSNYGVVWSVTKTLQNNPAIDEVASKFIAKPNGGWIASWIDDASREVFLVESPDLVTWSTTPKKITNTSASTIDWVIH